MLPLWRDRLHIGLGPDQILLLRRRRGLQAQVLDREQIAVSDPAAVLSTLFAALADTRWQQSDAVLVLSNHFLRYALVPWAEGIDKADEDATYVRHCFQRIYGDAAQHWTLQTSPERSGSTRLAAAMDQDLLSQLQTGLAQAQISLASVQPYLMSALNHWRRQLRGSQFIFAVAEPERIAMVLVRAGQWLDVRNRAMRGDWSQAMPSLFTQLSHSVDLADSGGTLFLHAPALGPLAWPSGAWHLQRLDQALLGEDARYAMAMAG